MTLKVRIQPYNTSTIGLSDFGVQAQILNPVEESCQTTDSQDMISQSLQTETINSYENIGLQVEIKPVNTSQHTQADQINFQVQQEIQAEIKSEIVDQDMQTEHNYVNIDIQTDHISVCSQHMSVQAQVVSSDIDAQTVNVGTGDADIQTIDVATEHADIQTEEVMTGDVQIQTDLEPEQVVPEMNDSDVQTEPLVQPVMRQLQTQTPEVKTRTGGVQVSIGNMTFKKRLRLGILVSKFMTKADVLESIQPNQVSNCFHIWRSETLDGQLRAKIAAEESKPVIDPATVRETALHKLSKLIATHQTTEKSEIINKLKENTIRCMIFDQEKYIEMEDEFKN